MTAAIESKDAGSRHYTPEYYEKHAEGSYESAKEILPLIAAWADEVLGREIRSIFDFGCGSGQWLRAAREFWPEIEINGFDPNSPGPILESKDVRQERTWGFHDIALCLEVAEHIEPESAGELIDTLCSLSGIVAFSAAIPGQGGKNHVNEQWPEYWAKLFRERGYLPFDIIRWAVWDNEGVQPWYKQNLIVYAQREILDGLPSSGPVKEMVHPDLYRGWVLKATGRRPEELAAAASEPSKTLNPEKHVYLVVPHTGSAEGNMLNTIVRAQNATRCLTSLRTRCSSALTHNFNLGWAEALNAREPNGVTHFAMLHSDVRPINEDWLDRLIKIMDEEGCDILSCIIAIKDGRGITSTGFDTDPWRPRRLTMGEVMKLPMTFGDEILADPGFEWLREHETGPILFNTGLWIARIDQPWAEDVCFDIRNRMFKDESGQFKAEFAPEDWEFSRWCHARGIRCKVTREIEIEHIGMAAFGNYRAWGSQEFDEGNVKIRSASGR